MKSPWKFLVGLTGRHNRNDLLESPAVLPDDASSNVPGHETPSTVPEFGSPAAGVESNAPIEPDGNASPRVDDVVAVADIASRVARVKPEKNTKALRKKPAGRVQKPAHLAPREHTQTPPVLSHSTLSNDQMLDDEIRQLRVQLAEKLTVQNAQLRRMLERFDR
jgi:hypothetical protein